MPPSPPALGTAPVDGKREVVPMTDEMLATLKQAVADLRKVLGKIDTSGIRG
jgi:hypothetical protein